MAWPTQGRSLPWNPTYCRDFLGKTQYVGMLGARKER